MAIVPVWSRAVQADLQGNSIAGQHSQRFCTPPDKQHAVGQHCGRSCGSARNENLANIVKQKRLASGHEDLLHAQIRSFASDAPYTAEPQFASACSGRGTHTAVVATQVAVEIRIEPKPRAYRPIVFGRHHNSPTTEDPTRTAFFDSRLQQRVTGESAPCFQLRSDALLVTDHRHQIARPAAAEHSDQLW
jgi:hypothetical protein